MAKQSVIDKEIERIDKELNTLMHVRDVLAGLKRKREHEPEPTPSAMPMRPRRAKKALVREGLL